MRNRMSGPHTLREFSGCFLGMECFGGRRSAKEGIADQPGDNIEIICYDKSDGARQRRRASALFVPFRVPLGE